MVCDRVVEGVGRVLRLTVSEPLPVRAGKLGARELPALGVRLRLVERVTVGVLAGLPEPLGLGVPVWLALPL